MKTSMVKKQAKSALASPVMKRAPIKIDKKYREDTSLISGGPHCK